MRYLVPFDDDQALRPEVVGEKFSSLARAVRLGFAVPLAASIRTEAQRYFSVHQRWPEGLYDEVTRFAEVLDLSRGVSIRSSAVREDLENQSFAGQYRSFLQVVSEEDLRSKIVQCWQSAESKIVQSYERASVSDAANAQPPLMGVILQRMVTATAAGVAFGCHPINPLSGEVVIEAVHGLAESLVSGCLTPHRAFVRSDGTIRVERPNADTDSNQDPLSEAQWMQIAGLLRKLEDAFGQGHLDIEWAIDNAGKLWLLQARRITTTAEPVFSVPPGTWTRKIANDLWADRLTPFLGRVMVDSQARFTLTRTCRILGIPVIRPTLAVINGYLYVNCESIRQVVSLVPRRLRTSDMRSLFPPEADFGDLADAGNRVRLSIAMRSVLLFVTDPDVNPLICLAMQSRRRKKIRRMMEKVRIMPERTPDQALHKTLGALEVMAVIQQKNQWPYSHTTFFTWLLRWLSVDLAGLSHSAFLGLLAERGRNVTINIERQFRRMAETIRQDRVFTDLVMSTSPEKLLTQLPPAFQQTFDQFLARYGCRSRHRTLYMKRWAEAPEEVIAILQALVRQGTELRPGGRDRYPAGVRPAVVLSGIDQRSVADDASKNQQASAAIGSIWLRRVLPVAVRLASRFLDVREELRFLLDEALFEIRRSLLTLGQLTGLEEQVMFLFADELQALAKGELTVKAAEAVAEERFRQYHQLADVPPFYVDGRPAEEFPDATRVLRGIGTSPGQVTGRARIVHDPTAADVTDGDILVAENTDPGWTPILSMVGGMVVEEGGLLNHCSIVARELKVPAIVGIRQATRKIPNGALISIDGGLGIVRIEEE